MNGSVKMPLLNYLDHIQNNMKADSEALSSFLGGMKCRLNNLHLLYVSGVLKRELLKFPS